MSRHEARAFAILEVVAPGFVLDIERTMPRKSRHVDGLLYFAEPNPALGPWAQRLAERLVVFETYSRTPRPAQLATAWLKLSWVTERWLAGDEPLCRGARPPALLVTSRGRPRSALRAVDVLAPLSTPGAYATAGDGFSSALFLDLRALPPVSGLSVLRYLPYPVDRHEAKARTDRLLGDDDLPITMRRTLMDAIMSDQIPVVPEERESAYERAVRRGIEIGEQRGEQRGIEIGERQAWLAIARKHASTALLTELEAEGDLAVLRRRVLALLER